VNAAIRAVNETYRAAHNDDHPVLGRQLEFGLPHVDVVSAWIAPHFAKLTSRPVESIALWQTAESIAILGGRCDRSNGTDTTAIATYAQLFQACTPRQGYRTLIAATTESLPESLTSLSSQDGEMTSVILMHHMLEASLQRSAIDRLTHAITVERQRERDAFQAAIASLGEQLGEQSARTEFLADELRARDQAIADQSAAIAMEQHALQTLQAAYEQLQHAQNQFRLSRAGRFLSMYARLKRAVLRR
jgi:hypothetical protein